MDYWVGYLSDYLPGVPGIDAALFALFGLGVWITGNWINTAINYYRSKNK